MSAGYSAVTEALSFLQGNTLFAALIGVAVVGVIIGVVLRIFFR